MRETGNARKTAAPDRGQQGECFLNSASVGAEQRCVKMQEGCSIGLI
jgi:hypothetical protein